MCQLGAAGRRTGTARPTIARALEKLQSALKKSGIDRAPQLTQGKWSLFTELGGDADGQRFHSVILQTLTPYFTVTE